MVVGVARNASRAQVAASQSRGVLAPQAIAARDSPWHLHLATSFPPASPATSGAPRVRLKPPKPSAARLDPPRGAPGSPSAPDPRPPVPARPITVRTMGNSISTATIPALCAGVAISAVELVHFLDPQLGAGAAEAAQAPALGSAFRWAFLPLSAAWGFFTTSVALTYRRHLQRAGAADAGGNRRLSERVPFMLCASAGLLEFFLFVEQIPGGGVVDPSAAARELGRAALGALPYAATATFFLSMLMVIVGHIRAGGEGGGTFVAGNGPIEAPAGGVLAKMAIGAATGLVALMAMAALFSA